MKYLRWVGIGALVLAGIAAGLYATRSNPMGWIAGRQLSGEVVSAPVSDWGFSDAHMTIAVETRPAAPHSVTTFCFRHAGALYVPAMRGDTKSWTHYALADPRVRLGIGGKIYPVRATRIRDPAGRTALLKAARLKYDFGGDAETLPLDDIWLFRMDSRTDGPPGAAADASLAQRVVAAVDRSERDHETDIRRHPVELLRFAGVRPGMRAADIGAGSGYTTELLARAAGPDGVVYGQNTPRVIEKYVSESWPARLAKPAMANAVRIDSAFDAPLPGVEGLDLVTMVFVYHDTLFQEVDRPKMNAALLAALRPGGSLVLVDHRARAGAGPEVGKTLHRIDEGLLRRELLSAGFQLAAEGSFMANVEDPRDRPFFEMDTPTDAFVHRYVRPR